MRLAGPIIGCLALGAFVIPGSYEPNQRSGSEAGVPTRSATAADSASGSRSAVLAGRVYGPLGLPLEGAEVTLAGSGFWPPRSVRSGLEGRFYWHGLPPGIYELRASLGSLSSPTVEGLILEAGSRRLLALELAEGWTLSGRVVDSQSGGPLEGAEVELATGPLGAYKRRVQTDAQGRFELSGVFGDEHQLFVDLNRYVPSAPIAVTRGEASIEVRLARGGAISGIVVDARGRPIAEAVVRLLGNQDTQPGTASPGDTLRVTTGPVPPISAAADATTTALVEQALTEADGAFDLRGLEAGRYTAIASHPNYAPSESAEVEIAAGGEVADLRIVMARGGELRGRVVDARRVGLAGIPVELQIAGERLPRMTVTGEDGSFGYRGVRGEATVTAIPYDLQPTGETLTVDEGRVDVLLVLARELLTLVGRVVDERGFGIDGALVTAKTVGSVPEVVRTAKTESDGGFSVPALPEPPYMLRIEHPAYSAARIDRLETEDALEVTLRTGVTIRGGVVDDWSGSPVGGVRIELEGPVERTTQSGRDGGFGFRRVPAGVYEALFRHEDYESYGETIEVESPRYVDRPQELNQVRLIPGGTIEGEVRDAYGDLVAKAEVTVGFPPDWDLAVRTGSTGRFILRGIPPGRRS